jgi:dCMP deaminase
MKRYGKRTSLDKTMTTRVRPPKDATFLNLAIVLSEQSTCIRRAVGCILTDSQHHIIGSGYNGNAAGFEHCIDNPCKGSCKPSNTDLHLCEAVHAEQNALMQCKDISLIYTCYVSTSPCMHCMKMLLNTPCQRIVSLQQYDQEALEMWINAGREFHLI